MQIKFPCGCTFPVKNNHIIYDLENVKLDCFKTWELISKGLTKGIFQLESQIGRKYAKDLQPENIEHLAALTAILRPGALEAKIGKKSITEHYIDRKNKKEKVEYDLPVLESILHKTYGMMIYQEDSLNIASQIAGFNLEQLNLLRYTIGKKKPEEMSKLKQEFIDGCTKIGKVNKEEAEEIFRWIEKSQRYSFNKSHAVGYSLNSYLSAYSKCHFPLQFFYAYLKGAKNKIKPHIEIYQLINEAKHSNIPINPPCFYHQNKEFDIIDGQIWFGLSNIRGIGNASISKILKYTKELCQNLNKQTKQLQWQDFLFFLSPKIDSTSVKALIESGSLDYLLGTRAEKLHEYKIYSKLKEREQKFIQQNAIISLRDALNLLIDSPTGKNGGCYTKTRLTKVKDLLKKLNNPTESLNDNSLYCAEREHALLGISMTHNSIESYDISMADCTIEQFSRLKGQNLYQKKKLQPSLIACTVKSSREIIDKNKNKMAFLSIQDTTGELDSVVVFCNVWEQYKNLLVEGNSVIVAANKDESNSCVIQRVYQLNFGNF